MPGPPPPFAEALSSRAGTGRGGREDAIETLIDMDRHGAAYRDGTSSSRLEVLVTICF